MSLLVPALLLVAPWTALAHVGGVPIRPEFDVPAGIEEAGVDSLTLRWRDGDEDEAGILVFRYQDRNVAPFTYPPDPDLHGERIGAALVIDPGNELVWDLTEVPAGTWHVYAETIDPPFCLVTFAHGLVVVRRDESPAPFGALIIRPDRRGDVFGQTAIVEIAAVSPEPPRVTIQAGLPGPPKGGEGFITDCAEADGRGTRPIEWTETVVEDAPMQADGPADRWTLEVAWDTREVEAGTYALRAQVEAPGGRETTVHGLGLLTIHHPPPPLEPPDGEEEDAPGEGPGAAGGCDCRAAGGPALGTLMIVFSLRRRRPDGVSR